MLVSIEMSLSPSVLSHPTMRLPLGDSYFHHLAFSDIFFSPLTPMVVLFRKGILEPHISETKPKSSQGLTGISFDIQGQRRLRV